MHYCNGLSLWSDVGLNKAVINLKCVGLWFYEYRYKVVLSNGQNSCNIGIGRYYDLITWFHHPHLHICTENPDESVQTICTTDCVFTADVFRIVFLKQLVLLTLQIPAIIDYS